MASFNEEGMDTKEKKDKIHCFQPLYSPLNFLDFNNIRKPKIKFQILVAHTQNHLLWSRFYGEPEAPSISQQVTNSDSPPKGSRALQGEGQGRTMGSHLVGVVVRVANHRVQPV